MTMDIEAYKLAQRAITDLKVAVLTILNAAGENGLKNSEIGRSLGIYGGHDGQHEGHISRSILHQLKEDEVVEQIQTTKHWKVKVKSK